MKLRRIGQDFYIRLNTFELQDDSHIERGTRARINDFSTIDVYFAVIIPKYKRHFLNSDQSGSELM
jgi:hypothetical protein